MVSTSLNILLSLLTLWKNKLECLQWNVLLRYSWVKLGADPKEWAIIWNSTISGREKMFYNIQNWCQPLLFLASVMLEIIIWQWHLLATLCMSLTMGQRRSNHCLSLASFSSCSNIREWFQESYKIAENLIMFKKLNLKQVQFWWFSALRFVATTIYKHIYKHRNNGFKNAKVKERLGY